MGTWTTNNGNKYNVNINSQLVSVMRAKGARFCWLSDNPGINDKNNNTYFEDSVEDGTTKRTSKQTISVLCEDGENITGYISHLVDGSATGTNTSDWFIIQPGTYPTCYHIQHSVDQDDVYIEEL